MTKAQQFFTANYPPTKLGTVGTLNVAFAGDNINVSVSGTVQTTFMKLANINTLAVGANAVITKKERNIELVLVLDTTGSMASAGKLAALKSRSQAVGIDTVRWSIHVRLGEDRGGAVRCRG